MAQGYSKYNLGINYICTGGVNFSADSFALVLSNTGPNPTQSTYTGVGVGEIATGNGYVSSTGLAIYGPPTFTNSGGTSTWAGQASLLTATGSIPQFSYAILYDTTNISKALLGWWSTVTAIQMNSTDTFQVSWTSNQILQFT